MEILIRQLAELNLEAFGQLFLAAFLGAAVGMERELARKSAGMRTYALISMGSAFFSLLSVLFFEKMGMQSGFDPSRIVSQIVVGVGFIGAGLIIFRERESKVQGLTTAAGIWVVAAIGVAVGLKFYDVAVFAAALTIIILIFLWYIEERLVKKLSSEPHHD